MTGYIIREEEQEVVSIPVNPEVATALRSKVEDYLDAKGYAVHDGRFAQSITDHLMVTVREFIWKGRRTWKLMAVGPVHQEALEASYIAANPKDASEPEEFVITCGSSWVDRLLATEWFNPKGANHGRVPDPELVKSVV